jgi:hypothetical protein
MVASFRYLTILLAYTTNSSFIGCARCKGVLPAKAAISNSCVGVQLYRNCGVTLLHRKELRVGIIVGECVEQPVSELLVFANIRYDLEELQDFLPIQEVASAVVVKVTPSGAKVGLKRFD